MLYKKMIKGCYMYFIQWENLLLILLTFVFLACTDSSKKQEGSKMIYAQIDSLIEAKDYFAAREIFEDRQEYLSELHQLKIGALLDNVFNKTDSSIEKMEKIFASYASDISDTIRCKLLSSAHLTYSKQFEYKKAKEIIQEILSNYSHLVEDEEKEDLENTLIIWNLLQDQPKQEIIIDQGVDLGIIRDKAGLQNLEVGKGALKANFVFDTGANLSTITETTAKQFDLKVLDGFFEVFAITGEQIQSKIAIAPEFTLGNITIKNAAFLVFPDEALAFPQIDYQINGILGFPVIEGLKEIQITREDRFIVPLQPTSSSERNLAIEFLTPLFYLKDERGKGTYTFDTGANNTMLYSTYFEKHNEELSKNYPETAFNFGGAGGQATKKGTYITFKPEVNGQSFSLDSVMVLKEPLKEDNKFLGNIGQDFIRQFDKMIINFEDMFIRFE